MHLARAVKDPDVATRGAVGGPRLVAFASKQVGHAPGGSLSNRHVGTVLRPGLRCTGKRAPLFHSVLKPGNGATTTVPEPEPSLMCAWGRSPNCTARQSGIEGDLADLAACTRRQQGGGMGSAGSLRLHAPAARAAALRAQAHYSYLKAARVLGLGSDNLIAVPSDDSGAMLPAGPSVCSSSLARLIQESCSERAAPPAGRDALRHSRASSRWPRADIDSAQTTANTHALLVMGVEKPPCCLQSWRLPWRRAWRLAARRSSWAPPAAAPSWPASTRCPRSRRCALSGLTPVAKLGVPRLDQTRACGSITAPQHKIAPGATNI
jgi:hypothetical protein